ncbi:MAG: cysteine--tRNA ligase [Promethearchaeota archaeon]
MKIYNSLTLKKEEFKSIIPNEVKIYVCGPTVYDSAHIGHAKSAVVFDLIHRYLKYKGYNVIVVKNYTDIDDKIIERANEKQINFKDLSENYISEYEEIMMALNVEPDTKNPRATEFIPRIIDFIQGLILKGNAYENNGSVYFSVETFENYGTAFKRAKEIESIDDGAVLTIDQDTQFGEDKRDPKDFALWKKMKEGEPFWESPWGKGRPGWHIECSAMVLNLLGETIDIHGGGQDLKFPHHPNEIAQSESYTGKKFSNYFIHNGFVNVDDEKMSKSLGNFFLVTDILKKYDPMVVRWYLVSSHYRSSVNYSPNSLEQSKKEYNKLINTIKKVYDSVQIKTKSKEMDDLILRIDNTFENIIKAMDDDFDTPVAIAEILSLFREINKVMLQDGKKINESFKNSFVNFIEKIDSILGVFPDIENKVLGNAKGSNEQEAMIKNLIDLIKTLREQLREKKLFDMSDQIRERLRELGIDIEDKKI